MMIDDIIAQLAALSPQPFAQIGGAANLAAIGKDSVIASPAAFVFGGAESADAEARDFGPVLQKVDVEIVVVIVIDSIADASGAQAASDIEALKAAVKACLVGYVPAEAQPMPIIYAGGQPIGLAKGRVTYELTFATSYLLEQTP